MKKRLLVIGTAAALSLCLAAGCGKKETAGDGAAAQTTEAAGSAEARTFAAAETTAEAATAEVKEEKETDKAPESAEAETETAKDAESEAEAETEAEAGTEAEAETGAEAETKAAEEGPIEAPVALHPLIDSCDMNEYDEELELHRLIQHYPAVHLSEKEAYQYEDLSDALEEWNLAQYKAAAADHKEVVELSKEIYELLDKEERDNPEMRYTYSGYEYYTDANVMRADSAVFSIQTHYEGYTGGAHGYYSNDGTTFDSGTGARLALTDIVTDPDALKEAIYKNLMKNYPDLYEDTVKEHLDQAFAAMTGERDSSSGSEDAENEDETELLCWNLGYEGLVFYFNPYVLASYAEGMQVAEISFADYPELFVKKYSTIPENYIIPLECYADNRVDVTNDGKPNNLKVYGEYDSEYPDAYTKIFIEIDGEKYEFNEYPMPEDADEDEDSGYGSFWAYDIHPYYAKNDGRSYLLLFTSSDNDYKILSTYEITDGIPKPGTTMNGGIPISGWDEDYLTWYTLTDPMDMTLESRLFVIGTLGGIRSYRLGDNAELIPNSQWYEVGGSLTLNMDAELSVVDEEGNFVEPIPLKKGTELMMYRTDGKDYVDFLYFEGTSTEIIRAEITDREDWPHKINGYPEDELFEDVIYAG